ncbi:MAG TPA: DUF2723 domain-containing protein [Anaerolineae bacterium]|nr:DUF2723 domain-containing protein [Anaerolineae bacterium]
MSAKKTPSLSDAGLVPLRVNWDAIAVIGIFLASFALYARTAAPGVLPAEGGEFQTNIYRLGVSHTGYPLYFLLAKLWTLLMPVGTIAYRANIFSGLMGALTLVVLYGLMRTLTERRVVALLTTILFGISRVQWSQAVIPDVYTLNSFFLVLIFWLAILWRAGRVPLWSVALVYGLSLTHHRTVIWLAPALALFVLFDLRRELKQPREIIKATAALFLPLLLYLYIPLRGESDVGVEYHANSFTQMIFATNVSISLRFGPPGFLWERITQVYLPLLIEQFTPIGFVFGLVGIGALALEQVPRGFPPNVPPRQVLVLFGLAHLAETAFAIVFWVVDSEIFFIPSYLTFLFFVGIGLALAFDFLAARVTADMPRRIAESLHIAGIVAICGFLLWTNFARNDESQNDEADIRWQEILAQPLEQNATLMGPWEDLTPLEYYQYVENRRPDLKRAKIVVYQDQLKLAPQGDIAIEVRRTLAQNERVYLTRHPDDTETLSGFDKFTLIPYASLWRVSPPRAARAAKIEYGEGDELRALEIAPMNPHAGDFITLGASWSPDAPLGDIRFVLRVRDRANNIWNERESMPFGGRAFDDSKNLLDKQGILIPPDAPPGEYTIELAAFARESQNPQTIVGASNMVTRTLEVAAASPPPPLASLAIPYPLQASLNGAQFLGYSVNSNWNTGAIEPRGGDVVEFSSWWQDLTQGDGRFQIKLRDANADESVLYDGALLPNVSGALNSAQIIRARQTLTLPPTAAPGTASILLSYNGQALPPIRILLAQSKRQFREPIIPHPQVALVGDSIQLLGYKLERTQYRPGDTLPLSLFWNANKTPEASYKVFVHLLDGNGVLRAQQDSIPQRGALPTNRWFPGEYIVDDYRLMLPSDLPSGEYHLVVGMYDETTGARVPLLDANGVRQPEDRVMLSDMIQVRP